MKQFFFIAMEPVAKGRPRVMRNGHSFTPSKTVDAETRIQLQVQQEWNNPPLEGPLTLSLVVYIPRPTSKKISKKDPMKNLYPVTRPDWDNYGKLVSDALNGILWKDDSQVVSAHVYKRYADQVPVGFGITVSDEYTERV